MDEEDGGGRGTCFRERRLDTMSQSVGQGRGRLHVELGRNPSIVIERVGDHLQTPLESEYSQHHDVELGAVNASSLKIEDNGNGVLNKKRPEPKVIDLDPELGSQEKNIERSMEPGTHEKDIRNYPTWIRRSRDIIVHRTTSWYKEYILHRIFRQIELAGTKDGRHLTLDASRDIPLIDERTGGHYIDNTIRSSRYTIWSFLPCQLWFQFTKAANFYFLVMGILQLIPGLSTTGTYTTILPLLFFLTLCIVREGIDDYRRYRLDKAENRRLACVLYGYRPGGVGGQGHSFTKTAQSSLKKIKGIFRKDPRATVEALSVIPEKEVSSDISLPLEYDSDPSPWASVKWIDLKVGDIIRLDRNEQVPADVVLLHADGRNGCAYIETMALDGETNLKSRQPPSLLAKRCSALEDLSKCRAQFAVEDPNLDLYEFNGKVSVDGKTAPLTLNSVVYRGSTLRNTARAIGIVINTGEECKIRMNASRNPKTKAPAMQKISNKVVIILAVFVVLLSFSCSAGYVIWAKVFESHAWYLNEAHLPFEDIFIAFAIEFNNLIPLALYVSLEIVKLCQFLLLHDVEMYDPISNTPMVSNTQTIFENLGQVNYIFSDKTGTLTENVMRFRKMSVAGTAWLHNIVKGDGAVREKESSSELFQENPYQSHQQEVSAGSTATSVVSTTQLTNAHSSKTFHAAPNPPLLLAPSITPIGFQARSSTRELLQHLRTNPKSELSHKVRLFVLSLALCHTCFPEIKKDGEIGFQAASPDELALVEAAQELGFLLTDRVTNSITLLISPGLESPVRETYEVLNIIEFSSKRKRMSIIVRFPDGRICIFCKGADSVVMSRLKLDAAAIEKASQVKRRNEQVKLEEAQEAVARKSREMTSMDSFRRSSLSLSLPDMIRRSISPARSRNGSVEMDRISGGRSSHSHERGRDFKLPRKSTGGRPRLLLHPSDATRLSTQENTSPSNDSQVLSDTDIFENCLQHIDDFASEGLRTLVYAYRFIDEEEYIAWAETYHRATTSLINRQALIESAGELIERNLELAGATAIEDKLQKGVPETIEKLQKANIKIWMLTGDKRETAINIAHAAQICKHYSRTVVLHHDRGDLNEQISTAFLETVEGRHTVVVVDGQTFVAIESDEELFAAFYNLILAVDSVICCRASPSQKATMVKTIRQKLPNSITLAIGDGGNDVSMIQEAHVGVGISGKEGLQAARVADYSIAQFRYLQRLLFVHGHWNYDRTSKSILWTFWKEMLFYSIQIMYQRWNGYTGTSLYESDSLAVWNTLFTSLCVMLPGIFEQHLSAETLLAVPELYSYGQNCEGFNLRTYGLWMLMAGVQSQIVFFMIYGLYATVVFTEDQGLFAMGDMAFSVCVVFINIKLL
jgi:phospholipid-translocating ATPase